MGHGMTMGSGMGAMGVWALLWTAVALVVLAALVAGAVWLVRRAAALGAWSANVGPDPVQILRRRYATGEVDDGEYERRMATLTK